MKHTILFAGHMIDKEDRKEPRFSASKEMLVRTEILKQLIKEKERETEVLIGIAGGACGGDILFHELCKEIGIKSEIYLAYPVEEFKKQSVSFAGKTWEMRFDRLINKLPVHILPLERSKITENDAWVAVNLWMLDCAFQTKEKKITLIALWDMKKGDGNGGTAHMIDIAKNKGARIDIVNINEI
ncbi:hypothetical protein IRZ71_11575 [Flavobacterium sp. ANB]|uniref:hypothetical protein n=1 Tax=unclassified Flavobacterium TaxID=196869 RepID=UPI0012B901B8|nr:MULTISPECIES: hypothetical protein [unclassified Flavobacterium]MBF4516991.1 hypothetical protein [Flavobacterium sp. ANB]MTD69113.1 hypothetical protein [Flavobacterium sp. LC2016-13]